MLRDTIATARRAGACGPILVRADSAYCRSKVVRGAGSRGAFLGGNAAEHCSTSGHRHHRGLRVGAHRIPWAIPDPDTGERLVYAAEIAEVEYTAFVLPGRPAGHRRLIVRRIPERNPSKL